MRLLDSIKANSLCQYLVVLGIDGDEAMKAKADALKTVIANCRWCESCSIAVNLLQPGGESFHICDVWHTMANKAWIDGADWVVLLGDDVAIDVPYHYRLFYRAFLDIAEQLGVSSLWLICLLLIVAYLTTLCPFACRFLLDLAVHGGMIAPFQDFLHSLLLASHILPCLVGLFQRIIVELS
jgi:hypothetical protein